MEVHPSPPHPRPAKRFHGIRHYGLFAGSNRAETLADVRELFNLDPPPAEQTTESDPAQPLIPFSFLDRAGLLASRNLSLQSLPSPTTPMRPMTALTRNRSASW
jgi:hypothetical protein